MVRGDVVCVSPAFGDTDSSADWCGRCRNRMTTAPHTRNSAAQNKIAVHTVTNSRAVAGMGRAGGLDENAEQGDAQGAADLAAGVVHGGRGAAEGGHAGCSVPRDADAASGTIAEWHVTGLPAAALHRCA